MDDTDQIDIVPKRILALILSLATIAELGANRSLPVRIILYWLLRRAELAVQSLFFPPLDDPDMPRLWEGIVQHELDEATASAGLIRIAGSLRAMAAILGAMARACPDDPPAFAREPGFIARLRDAAAALHHVLSDTALNAGIRPARLNDTS